MALKCASLRTRGRIALVIHLYVYWGVKALENMTALPRIVRMQVVAGVLGSLALIVFGYVDYAYAYLFGVLLMTANAWWLARRLNKALVMSAEAGQRSLYAGAALRFVALIAGLLLGHFIGLHLMLVAAGIFVAQALIYVGALLELKKEQDDQESSAIKNEYKGDGFG